MGGLLLLYPHYFALDPTIEATHATDVLVVEMDVEIDEACPPGTDTVA